MSEIYPCDDLEWSNNAAGVPFRNAILNMGRLDVEEKATLLNGLEQADIDDMQLLSALLGIPTTAGTLWKDYRVAELKLALALAIGKIDDALSLCEWLIDFDQIETQRLQQYRYIYAYLQCEDKATYSENMQKLFSAAVIRQAEKLMNGEFPYAMTNELQVTLLEAYQKLQRVKANV
jgi:hypothetical protein